MNWSVTSSTNTIINYVSQPLLLKQLLDLGVEISSGRLSQFITDDLDVFHDEKNSQCLIL